MNTIARIKMLKAMEFIARNINDETILNRWLSLGIADGDIEYGDLSVGLDNADKLKYYMEDEAFADMMHNFLWCMARAWKSGGLYCDGLVSKDAGEAYQHHLPHGEAGRGQRELHHPPNDG